MDFSDLLFDLLQHICHLPEQVLWRRVQSQREPERFHRLDWLRSCVVPVLSGPHQAQAGTSQTRSSLPLEAPKNKDRGMNGTTWRPPLLHVFSCWHIDAQSQLTIGSETSGTMLHWILQPLEDRRMMMVFWCFVFNIIILSCAHYQNCHTDKHEFTFYCKDRLSTCMQGPVV